MRERKKLGQILRDLQVLTDAEVERVLQAMRRRDDFTKFGQVYVSATYPGVVKAWHYHKLQVDNFVCIAGMVKLVLVDTRDGLGGNRLAAGATLAIAMPARPSSLGTSPAASLNVTAVGATVPGYLTLYPCGGTTPLVSSVNYAGSAPVANKVVVTVPADGRVCLEAV